MPNDIVDSFIDLYENAELSYHIDCEDFSLNSEPILNPDLSQITDQSVPISESQVSIAVATFSMSSSQCAQSTHVIHGIRSYSNSECRCSLCFNPSGRSRVPKQAIKETWLRKKSVHISGVKMLSWSFDGFHVHRTNITNNWGNKGQRAGHELRIGGMDSCHHGGSN